MTSKVILKYSGKCLMWSQIMFSVRYCNPLHEYATTLIKYSKVKMDEKTWLQNILKKSGNRLMWSQIMFSVRYCN
jgi:hypothetical protein